MTSDRAGHRRFARRSGTTDAVKALRRSLVTELEVDRAQVAFVGYWREASG